MIFAFQVFGHDLPNPGIAIAFIALSAGVFLFNRSNPPVGDARGVGIEHECPRCGRRYKPEQVQLTASGDAHHTYDDRCPGCGWDYNRGDPEKDHHFF